MQARETAGSAIRRLALVAAVLAATGCAMVPTARQTRLASAPPQVRACESWLGRVDAAVERAGVRDAQPWRIPGFAYLRVDRFTASFAQQSAGDPAQFAAWVARARALGREARRVELTNLSDAGIAALGAGSRTKTLERTERCATVLENDLMGNAAERARLVRASAVPSAYEPLQRTLGLYPLLRVAFAQGVAVWHRDARLAFRRFASGALPGGATRRYAPAPGPVLRPAEIASLIARGRGSPLGIPPLSAGERQALLATFAPVIEVGTAGDYDRIGALRWTNHDVPQVDASRPTVYGRLTYTRYGATVLPQLVYTAWFPERPASSALDVLAGTLDGIVFRVTLGRAGLPLVYDSVHPCGCYHMFFPTRQVQARPSPHPGDEWAFSPAEAPDWHPGQRILVYVASHTHYLSGIGIDRAEAGATVYRIAPERELLTLPLPAGGSRSLFGPDGLVAGTERAERLLFWPMGVRSAGTMRQDGARATAFLGERHFDDADLIEQRFRMEPSS